MILREVTVGRSKDCDIYLDSRCIYASGHHGTIYYDGTQLMFKDTSKNGTMINNVSVKHRAVPIKHGDMIMIAGQYPLNWNQINQFFPPSALSYQQPVVVDHKQTDYVASSVASIATAPNTSKWNWGAFGLYPIWGFFNGCWWAIFISFFFGWLFPIPNIVFGLNGSKWSWENKRWNSIEDYNSSQSSWAIPGIIVTCINVFIYVFYIFALIAALS